MCNTSLTKELTPEEQFQWLHSKIARLSDEIRNLKKHIGYPGFGESAFLSPPTQEDK